MVLPSDHDLLRRYARDDDHAAFAEVVRRYIGLVYAAARRQTRFACSSTPHYQRREFRHSPKKVPWH